MQLKICFVSRLIKHKHVNEEKQISRSSRVPAVMFSSLQTADCTLVATSTVTRLAAPVSSSLSSTSCHGPAARWEINGLCRSVSAGDRSVHLIRLEIIVISRSLAVSRPSSHRTQLGRHGWLGHGFGYTRSSWVLLRCFTVLVVRVYCPSSDRQLSARSLPLTLLGSDRRRHQSSRIQEEICPKLPTATRPSFDHTAVS